MAQQFVILSQETAGHDGMAPLGPRQEIIDRLATMNTAPAIEGDEMLYGPGIRIELPPEQDPVLQMLMSITEEEIAWQVILRISKAMQWKILDPETGRELTP
jgi:hypothetical protein